jgi:hypothetical protein
MSQQTRSSSVGRFREEGRKRHVVRVVSLIGLLLFCATSARAQTTFDLNVSGYELFPGIDCIRNNGPATCGVTFGGWTGGGGAVAGGWRKFPGNRHGFWEATLERQGTAAFGSSVTVLGGSLKLALRAGATFLFLSGSVTGGSVQWPSQGGTLGCGTNVALVAVELRMADLGNVNVSATFNGCLHDLPAGSIIPPTIWGTLTIP